MEYVEKLRALLDKKVKKKLFWLVIFSIFLSMVEVIGISAIMPFIDMVMDLSSIDHNKYYQWLYVSFGVQSNIDFVIIFGSLLIGFYLFRGGVNLLYSYTIANFTEKLYAQTTEKLFTIYLSMPYQVFVSKNSSYLTKVIITEASLMSLVIYNVLIVLSEIFIVILFYALMLVTSWKITLLFTIVLLIKLFFIITIISKKLKKLGVIRAESQAGFYEIVNRVLGNFKHIKLQSKNSRKNIINEFSTKVNNYADANSGGQFFQEFPRMFIETGGFSLIVFLLIFLVYFNQSDIAHALPTLSLFVLALYRLLPSVNRIVSGYNTLMYCHKSIDIINNELKTPQENLKDNAVNFNKQIELKDVAFAYQENPVLNNINLIIKKGEKVAFIGESGSGKSTLIDLIIGLHQPNQGALSIDNVSVDKANVQSWRSQIGYISQQTYLFDGTIEENICFGRKLNKSLLEKVLKQANLFSFLQTKQGVRTLVGENGIQLSGGQRQRVAIARVLYGQFKVLILDEATSALDSETEENIMNEIYNIFQDKTLIIITHRLSTIKDCNKIYEIKNGMIISCKNNHKVKG
jgi:ATP-binding cassette, subfamily B, bacterial PglK